MLSNEDREILAQVLDEILPPRADGKLPGAGALGVGAYVEKTAAADPEQTAMLTAGLADLRAKAAAKQPGGFAALTPEDRRQLASEQAMFFFLMLHGFAGYYQDPRVLEALGGEPRAPHPKGYAMADDDWSILDTVRSRRPMYR